MVSGTSSLNFGQEQTGLILLTAVFLMGICFGFMGDSKKLIGWTALVTSIVLLIVFSIF